MNKRMRELIASMEAKQKEAKSFLEGEEKDLAKAETLLNEIEDMQKEYDLLERTMKMEKSNVDADEVIEEKKAADSTKAFADAARRGFKGMSEGTLTDGGYTVPEDISTKIEHLREAKASLIDLVTVEKVNTNKGQRTYKTRAQQTGFTKVGEGGKIGGKNTPQFARYTYEIDKYAGYFPVTNELLEDSDAAIVSELTQWIADESRVTRNKLVIAALDEKYTRSEEPATAETIATLDDIKRILNVVLGQAFKATSTIVTNDDGLQWLDTLKDENGMYLLQPNPADPMQMRLCAGATTVPVRVEPNADLPTDEANGVPFYIGDFKEGVIFFDRKLMTIKASDIAAVTGLNAFEEDLTLFRAIEREDCVLRDEAAFVKGYFKAATQADG